MYKKLFDEVTKDKQLTRKDLKDVIIEFDIEYDTPLTLTSFTDFVKTDLSHLLTDENFAFYVYKKVGV